MDSPGSFPLQDFKSVASRIHVLAAEQEFRELSEAELAHLKTANLPGDIRVRDLEPAVLKQLYRKGLVYFEIPIGPDDRFSIPPLEVSGCFGPRPSVAS